MTKGSGRDNSLGGNPEGGWRDSEHSRKSKATAAKKRKHELDDSFETEDDVMDMSAIFKESMRREDERNNLDLLMRHGTEEDKVHCLKRLRFLALGSQHPHVLTSDVTSTQSEVTFCNDD